MGDQARVPAGVRTGGQWTNRRHGRGTVTLERPADTGGGIGAWTESIADRDSVFTRRYDTVQDKLAMLQDELAAAVADLATDDGWNTYLDTMRRFHRYSPSNQLLIQLQTGGRATRVAGFTTWKDLGPPVRKGEKGIVILAPRTTRIPERDGQGWPVTDQKGRPVTTTRVVGFTTATVFDVSQTDGQPLPDHGSFGLSEQPPEGLRQDLEAVIADAGFQVRYGDTGDDAKGYTHPDGYVMIGNGQSSADTVRTLAHEAGHIYAGHLDQEHRGRYHTGAGGERVAMEIEADSIAHSILRMAGMSRMSPARPAGTPPAGGNTNPDRVRRAAETVARSVKTILGTRSWASIPAEQP